VTTRSFPSHTCRLPLHTCRAPLSRGACVAPCAATARRLLHVAPDRAGRAVRHVEAVARPRRLRHSCACARASCRSDAG
jgi:hypothetical protein